MIPAALKRRIALAAAGGVVAIATSVVGWFEGRSLVAYLDPVGVPTICEGITAGVRLGDTATPAECDTRTGQEVRKALAAVDAAAPGQPDTRRAALASFVYNVGPGAFRSSTLLRKLKAGDVRGGCDELLRWVYAGGKRLAGLEKRRAAERELCLYGLP